MFCCHATPWGAFHAKRHALGWRRFSPCRCGCPGTQEWFLKRRNNLVNLVQTIQIA